MRSTTKSPAANRFPSSFIEHQPLGGGAVRRHPRSLLTGLLAIASAVALAACGSSSSSSSASSSGSSSSASSSGGTVNLVMGTAPDSLDPGFGYTTQSAEATWLSYTGLDTYTRANGLAGTELIPGLATSLPVITDGGKTYTVTLRKGLVFSNGQPVGRQRLRVHRRARDQDPVGRLGPVHHRPDRRRDGLRQRQGHVDLRHHDERLDRPDRDPPRRALRRV